MHDPNNSGPISPTVIMIVAVNLCPAIGVLLFGWSINLVLLSYWVEAAVVGILAVPRIIMAKGTISNKFTSVLVGAFFFCFVSLVFLIVMDMKTSGAENDYYEAIGNLNWDEFISTGLVWSFLTFGFMHLCYLCRDYLYGDVFSSRVSYETYRPLLRLFIIEATIIISDALFHEMVLPKASVLILIGLKITIEIILFSKKLKTLRTREHTVLD